MVGCQTFGDHTRTPLDPVAALEDLMPTVVLRSLIRVRTLPPKIWTDGVLCVNDTERLVANEGRGMKWGMGTNPTTHTTNDPWPTVVR